MFIAISLFTNICLLPFLCLLIFVYCHICRLMGDFSCSVKIRESVLMSYFTRQLQSLVKFWQRKRNWEVDSASKLWEQSGFTVSWKFCLILCSLRIFTHNYLRLPVFGKRLKWVFQVCFRSFPVRRDSL